MKHESRILAATPTASLRRGRQLFFNVELKAFAKDGFLQGSVGDPQLH